MAEPLAAKIAPRRVRYIKLGDGGRWEKACIEGKPGLLYIGFGTADPERFALCIAGKWDELRRAFRAEAADKGRATNVTHQVRTFFEDDGTILWITFHAQRLFWATTDATPPTPRPEMKGAVRRVRGGWRSTDVTGQEELTMDRLSGALTKLAMYRGTSCDVDVADYAVRRINGEKMREVQRAIEDAGALERSVTALMGMLTPKDFELLVDLVFSASGWRRVGVVGKTQKTIDIDLILPSTQERAFVQVKSHADKGVFADYAARFEELGDAYERMFFVYHSGLEDPPAAQERVSVIGPARLATMVIDAGLVNWLIEKVS